MSQVERIVLNALARKAAAQPPGLPLRRLTSSSEKPIHLWTAP